MGSSHASVCVLSYERPRLLHRTLLTLMDSGAPLELLIHDDGSTDPEVYAILDFWAPKATIIRNPPGWNQGQGTALNRTFRMATGDLIVKCDQDLDYRPGWLAEVRRTLARNANFTHFHGDHKREPTIGMLGLCHYHHDPVDMSQTILHQWDGWQQHPLILGSAFVLTRAAWDLLGPFQEHSAAFNEDGDMQRRVHASGHFALGLPNDELAMNVGMGPPLSTVVNAESDGSISVSKIHDGPVILNV